MSLNLVVGGAILVTALAILIKSCRRVDTLHANLEILQKLVEGINKADGVTLPGQGPITTHNHQQ